MANFLKKQVDLLGIITNHEGTFQSLKLLSRDAPAQTLL